MTTPTPSRSPRPRISHVYRLGTIIFLGIVGLVGGVIAILAFSKTTVTIYLQSHEIAQSTDVTVAEQPDQAAGELAGSIITSTVELTATVEPTGSAETVDEFARGRVTLINRLDETQQFKAQLRLRAQTSGIFFRTTDRSTVPANGEVEVEVVAEQRGPSGNIRPDRFEIVALEGSDELYGESAASMTGGIRTTATVSPDAIAAARQKLEADLAEKVLQTKPATTNEMTLITDSIPVSTTITSHESSATTGPVKLTGQAQAAAVAIRTDEQGLNATITSLIQSALPAGETLAGEPTVTWKLAELRERDASARLKLTVTQTAHLKTDDARFSAENFVRVPKQVLIDTLSAIAGIQKVSIRMMPAWATQMPSLPSQIQVIIKTD